MLTKFGCIRNKSREPQQLRDRLCAQVAYFPTAPAGLISAQGWTLHLPPGVIVRLPVELYRKAIRYPWAEPVDEKEFESAAGKPQQDISALRVELGVRLSAQKLQDLVKEAERLGIQLTATQRRSKRHVVTALVNHAYPPEGGG